MGVFPAASSKHVPAPFATLMSDPVSFLTLIYHFSQSVDQSIINEHLVIMQIKMA